MAIFKKRIGSPIINLASSMDLRSNNEMLNIGDEAAKLVSVNLENADLFYTNSVATRNGTVDLSNGVVTTPTPDNTFIDLTHVSGSSLTYSTTSTTPALDYPGFILIASGNDTISRGTLNISEVVSQTNYEADPSKYDAPLNLKISIYPLNQSAYPASGLGAMSGTTVAPDNILHDIAILTNYNAPPYPNFEAYKNTSNYGPYAETDSEIQMSTKTFNGSSYVSSGTYTFNLSAPLPIKSGSVYWARIDVVDPDDNFRAIRLGIEESTSADPYPNVRFAQEFYYIGAPANALNAVRLIESNTLTSKYTPVTLIENHQTPGYLIYDDAESVGGANTATVSGLNSAGTTKSIYQSSYLAYTPYTSPVRTTNSAWVGQRIPLSFTGTKTLYGGYHYASLNWDQSSYNLNTPAEDRFRANVNPRLGVSGTYPKTVVYEAGLFRVNSETGSVDAHTYFNNSTKLASFSGTINFSDENLNVNDLRYARNYDFSTYPAPNYHMQKVYSIFDNPVTVASGNYIYAIRYFDELGNSYSDFNYRTTPVGPAFINDIMFGYNVKATGGIVENYNDDQKTFINDVGLYGSGLNMACGLIDIPSGNGITLVYNYTTANENQKVIIGQSDKLYWTEQTTPEKENWTVIHSGAAVNNDALWSAVTNNDLLFAHQYSQSSGQVWDSTWTGVSYDHGKRPIFTASGISAAGSTMPSGDYQIMLATSMESGGFRASEISGLTITSGSWINISNLNMGSQYPFDLNTQSTYVLITTASGNNFYLPTLYDAASLTPTELPQPIANNITDVYINTPVTTSGTDVSNGLDPSYPQSYLTMQTDTPKFKKITNFFNYMIGVGDPNRPSTMFHSEVLGPQIWGTEGSYHGTYDIDPSNGQNITGMEVDKQFLMMFKKNSTYRIEATDNTDAPFAIVNISPNIGALGFFTTVNTEKGIFGLSQYGPFICSANSIEIIGDEILPWFSQLNHDDLTFSVALHDQKNGVITWSIANNNTNIDRNYALVFNYRLGSWSVRVGQCWNAAGVIRDVDGFDELWIGDVMGSLKQDNVGNQDSDLVFADGDGVETFKNIQMLIETPWMSFNGPKGSDSNRFKLMRFMTFNVESAVDSNLVIETYYDYSDTPAYSRTLPINTGGSNQRINLGGQGKICKFKIYNTGAPNKVKVNKFLFEYQSLGPQETSG